MSQGDLVGCPQVKTKVVGGQLVGAVDVGQGHGEIKHVGEDVGYVLEGEFELTIHGTTYCLKAGDSFFFRFELPHSYRYPGAIEARVLRVNAPPTL